MKKKLIILLFLVFISGCSTEKKEVDTFKLSYQNVEIVPGQEFKSSALKNEELNFVELSSCAFDGNDKVYTYEDMEITASPLKGKDIVYSVYFLNERITTKEGVKITDDKKVMIEKYGNDYKKVNNKYNIIIANIKPILM